MPHVLLRARQLQVGYSGHRLLPPLDLEVRAHECWGVVGPNGAGKTTLLRTLLGLLPALEGAVELPGGRALGYVPQRSDLDPTVPGRVIDLVRAGTERGWSFVSPLAALRARPQVERALRDTDTDRLAREQWTHLSEGQKQRVLMARALAGEPQLLVLDEPTSAMDLHAERGIFQLLDRLRHLRELGILVVSHHLPVLVRSASHLLFVDKDEGVVLAGPLAEVLAHPAFVARYGVARVPGPAAAPPAARIGEA